MSTCGFNTHKEKIASPRDVETRNDVDSGTLYRDRLDRLLTKIAKISLLCAPLRLFLQLMSTGLLRRTRHGFKWGLKYVSKRTYTGSVLEFGLIFDRRILKKKREKG